MDAERIAECARQAAEAERRYAETRRRQSDGSGFSLDQISAAEARADLFETLAGYSTQIRAEEVIAVLRVLRETLSDTYEPQPDSYYHALAEAVLDAAHEAGAGERDGDLATVR